MSITPEEIPTRGQKAKMQIILKDKAGTPYYAMFGKDDFEIYPDMRSVEVYDSETMEPKKYIKSFLTIKEVLVIKKKKVVSKF